MISSISSAGFTPTLPASVANTQLTAAAGEQDPAVQSTSVKQTAESTGPDLQQQQEHAKHDSAAKQQQQQDLKVISELAARDREVRAHEQAHASVGGAFAGSPTYTLEKGPDGASYAVGGEVSISTGGVSGDPEATIRKADTVRRAALAPADPSAQDRSVAAQATQMKIQAQAELANQAQNIDGDSAEQPHQASQNKDDNTSVTTANDPGDPAAVQELLERNLMTEQALGRGNDFGRTIDQLL